MNDIGGVAYTSTRSYYNHIILLMNYNADVSNYNPFEQLHMMAGKIGKYINKKQHNIV